MEIAPPNNQSDVPIRVLVATTVGRFHERVAELIAGQHDMVVVGQVQGPIALLLWAGEQIDVVVLTARYAMPLPGVCSHLLNEYPHLRILVLGEDDQSARLFWLGLRQQRLRHATPGAVIDSIRKAYRLNQAL